jgi:hypothetical protein
MGLHRDWLLRQTGSMRWSDITSFPDSRGWLYTYLRNFRALVDHSSAMVSLLPRERLSTLLSFSRSVRPYGPDRSERIAPALGQGWLVRPDLVRCDGRGFVATGARPVHTGDRRSANWTCSPSGPLDHDVESNPTRYRIGLERIRVGSAVAALGRWWSFRYTKIWLDSSRWDGIDRVVIGVCACICWWSQFDGTDHDPSGSVACDVESNPTLLGGLDHVIIGVCVA